MKLTKVHIKEFQSVLDSNEFNVDDITCLVGKNEAGKTAILKALYKLNPLIENDSNYNVTDDYPRWNVDQYNAEVNDGNKQHAIVAKATFSFENDDFEKIHEITGEHGLISNEIVLSRGYENKTFFSLKINEEEIINYQIKKYNFTADVNTQLSACKNTDEVINLLSEIEQTEDVKFLREFLQKVLSHVSWEQYIYTQIIKPNIPKFFYFDDYYQMVGCANIESLQKRVAEKQIKSSDYPLLGLLNRARLDLSDLLSISRTRELKNRIEGAGNNITRQIINYWSQNRHLTLTFDIREARPDDPEEMRTGTNIWCDVYDSKHRVTTELGTRSKGFVWFFSFLSWYGDIKSTKDKVILLLDEPGLSLHGKAQEDLLRYFDAEIKDSTQLIYTTHSPFMVDSTKFDRVRIVQDLSVDFNGDILPEKEGSKVFTDVLEASSDSLFPLQGALGYEIYQTLFIGPNSLVVEGVSDLLYLQTMSQLLEERNMTCLNKEWVITPVGGSDKVPTFVALLGAQSELNIAVLIDFQKKDHQSIENLYKKKLLEKKQVVTFVDFTESDEADIEDMFSPSFYLSLVNEEYKASLTKEISLTDLPNEIRIIKRIEKYLEKHPLNDGAYNHYRPARILTAKINDFKSNIDDETLQRFEKIFVTLNGLIK